ncbi:CYFA0S20e01068g1_1 [Cyberlindnera fabianii]|uniref:CYFA0S20e01068g1_1 n=1 Tax=Cyberlindnera fabianii TaxID=36022 RepID=A0A061B912_CYBFA|nr:Mitochondrial RNA-splicing protein MRS3 [Cyberlindnera fabianii]CDR45864.1 CYFA0S20e01068g1_1 [Cyberlindnera fabianii]
MSTSTTSTDVIHANLAPVITQDEVDYEALPEGATLTAQCVAGAFAGILEHTVMYPVDALKTRMQALNASKNGGNGIFRSIYTISSKEGWLSLWRGTSSVILGAGPAHAVYFGTYEYVKKSLIHEKEEGHQPFRVALAGASATITSEALMNPFDVIKQRMQLAAQEGSTSDFIRTTKNILSQEGFHALYTSYPTTIAMTIPFTALNFVVYESATKILNPSGNHDPLKHCVAGGLAGGTAAALTTPLDCVKTFLQTKNLSLDAKIKGTDSFYDATKLIYKMEGYSGFWRGLKPRIVANVPSTAICWTAYEMAKYYLMKS